MRNKLDFIKRVLYRLRHTFGLTVSLVEITNSSVNYLTGEQELIKATYEIPKVIRLPRNTSSFMRLKMALGIFNRGGESDRTVTDFIIDAATLPIGIVPDLRKNYLLVNGQRFNIKRITELDNQYGYLVQAEAFEGMEQ